MTTEFKSHSQAGQDIFVKRMLIDTGICPIGFYLDIGCNHPFDLSNTYALEQQGWTGLLMDNDAVAVEMCRKERSAKNFIAQADATKYKFEGWIGNLKPGGIDYLSLDVDFCTSDTLTNMLANTDLVFRVATIEHDSYRFGPGPRDYMRGLMREAGYELICQDVSHGGHPYEDWWATPSLVDMKVADKFRSIGQEGIEIVARP